MNPGDTTDVTNMRNSGYYFQGWSPEPTARNCTDCDSPGPSWGPTGISGLATNVWQYGIQPGCQNLGCHSNPVLVDLDLTNPGIPGAFGFGQCDNMLFIPAS